MQELDYHLRTVCGVRGSKSLIRQISSMLTFWQAPSPRNYPMNANSSLLNSGLLEIFNQSLESAALLLTTVMHVLVSPLFLYNLKSLQQFYVVIMLIVMIGKKMILVEIRLVISITKMIGNNLVYQPYEPQLLRWRRPTDRIADPIGFRAGWRLQE